MCIIQLANSICCYKWCISAQNYNIAFTSYKRSGTFNCMSCSKLFMLLCELNNIHYLTLNKLSLISYYYYNVCSSRILSCLNGIMHHRFITYFVKHLWKIRMHTCSFTCGKYHSLGKLLGNIGDFL